MTGFLRLGSGKTPATVILDGKKFSEDEDDEDGQFVVEETAPPPSDIPEMEVVLVLFMHVVFRQKKICMIQTKLTFFSLQRNSLELQGDDKHGESCPIIIQLEMKIQK